MLSAARATALVHPTGGSGVAALVITSAGGSSDTLSTLLVASYGDFGEAYHPRSLVAVFKPGAVQMGPGESRSELPASVVANGTLTQALSLVGADELVSCLPNCLTDAALAATLRNPLVREIYEVMLSDTNVVAACTALRADTADVLDAHPNWVFRPQDVTPVSSRFGEQWWLKNTGQFLGTPGVDARISSAWDITTGQYPVEVGVVDLGVDTAQVGLQGRAMTYWPTPNGLATDVECPYPCGRDLHPHGTPVAGMIAASGNDPASPVAGVDWTARVLNLKVASNAQTWDWNWVCAGCIDIASLMRAVDIGLLRGTPLLNMSLAGGGTSTEFELILGEYFYQRGLSVVSAGNIEASDMSTELALWPARYTNYALPVGALDNRGNRWVDTRIPWRQLGMDIDHLYPPLIPNSASAYSRQALFAPGGRFIQTLLPHTQAVIPSKTCYDIDPTRVDSLGFGGTSAAAAVVTGTAALLKSRLTCFVSGEDLRKAMEATAVQVTDANDTRLIRRLDARRAIDALNLKYIGHVSATGGTWVGATTPGLVATIYSWPGIPSGTYSAIRFRVQKTVQLPYALTSRPLWWTRADSSLGAGPNLPSTIYDPGDLIRDARVNAWIPQIDTVSSTSSSVTMETYVYLLQAAPGQEQYWWPTDVGGTRFAFTYVGTTVSPTGVDASRPAPLQLSCAPTVASGAVRVLVEGADASSAQLEVMDVQGRRVRSLLTGPPHSGPLRIEWDLTDDLGARVRPGLFFVRLTTAGRSLSRRVIVIR